MGPAGTAAKAWGCPAISPCWSCRLTARSSIRSSGFGTICAATGSPTRYFVAWRTSWTPARWRGTGSPPTTAWSAHSARSPGLRLRPLYSGARVVPAIEPWPRQKTHSCPEISGDPYDYDIAVFLRDLTDRWREFHRLADLRTEILADTGVFIEARPFREGGYRERTPL